MPLTEQERIDLKSGMIVMEKTIAVLSQAQTTSADAQTKLAEQIGELVTEMRERDIKDEYFRNKITKMEENQSKAMELFLPVIDRSRASQEKWDRFYLGMTSNWGRLVSIAIIVAVAMALGIDVSKLFKL